MKKGLKIAVPIFLIVGCMVALAICYIKSLDISAHSNLYSLNLSHSTINKKVGDKFNIIDTCGIEYESDDSQKPYFKSEDYNLLNIGSTSGNAECLGKGNVKVFILLKVDEDEILKKEVVVNISEKIVYPTSVSLEKSSVTMICGETASNKLTMSKNANSRVSVSYTKGIISYDYMTGIIKSNGLVGEDVVTIEIDKSKTEKFVLQFKVTVQNKNEVDLTKTINKGETVKVSYGNILKSSDSIEISEPIVSNNNIKIKSSEYGYLIVTGISTGECIITIDDSVNFVKIKIIVL